MPRQSILRRDPCKISTELILSWPCTAGLGGGLPLSAVGLGRDFTGESKFSFAGACQWDTFLVGQGRSCPLSFPILGPHSLGLWKPLHAAMSLCVHRQSIFTPPPPPIQLKHWRNSESLHRCLSCCCHVWLHYLWAWDCWDTDLVN